MSYIIDSNTWRSPNHSPRTKPISALVLHTGEGTRKSDLEELTRLDSDPVSSHYYVCRDGTIYQLVDDSRVAYHAGISAYQGLSGWNEFSLGIETEHKTGQDWPGLQRDALAWLCRRLISAYGIAQQRVVAHRWVAPDRRDDPSNWPDAELRSWIAGLYAVPPLAQPKILEVFDLPRRYRLRTAGVYLRSAPYLRQDTLYFDQAGAGWSFPCDAVVEGDAYEGSKRWLRIPGPRSGAALYVHESQVVPEPAGSGALAPEQTARLEELYRAALTVAEQTTVLVLGLEAMRKL